MVVDVGKTQTSMCLDLVNKAPYYKQIAMGLEQVSEQTKEETESEIQPSSASVTELAEKISKQLQLFVSVHGSESVKGIWLCGGGANSKLLLEALIEKCDIQCGVVDPFSLFVDKASKRHRSAQSSVSFATAAGLALRGIHWLEVDHAA